MWKSDVVAQQQRALVLKSSEMLKHIAEAPTMRMGWVKRCLSGLVVEAMDHSFLSFWWSKVCPQLYRRESTRSFLLA